MIFNIGFLGCASYVFAKKDVLTRINFYVQMESTKEKNASIADLKSVKHLQEWKENGLLVATPRRFKIALKASPHITMIDRT